MRYPRIDIAILTASLAAVGCSSTEPSLPTIPSSPAETADADASPNDDTTVPPSPWNPQTPEGDPLVEPEVNIKGRVGDELEVEGYSWFTVTAAPSEDDIRVRIAIHSGEPGT